LPHNNGIVLTNFHVVFHDLCSFSAAGLMGGLKLDTASAQHQAAASSNASGRTAKDFTIAALPRTPN
jgi:hypothetical protein